MSTEDNWSRVFFIELNLEGEDKDSGNETRNLFAEASLNYQLDKTLFPDLDENQINEDDKYFLELLNRLNTTVKSITSQDDTKRTLNIDKVIESYSK
ncbi:hypothetical protein RJP21_08725 [Paenibacillus sp. VCA1]|uniref:hypothetical protein n=1 Tax=Paenibacillus sp. VCA1 TaxID=3039148 RepID=UPI002871EE20|nr:hypothetical protein [Paenibacillus sp. VCA1]MDR9853683.1 hypothetical protein [Paenibacillus sp. VCA1]